MSQDDKGWRWLGITVAVVMLLAVITFGLCVGVCGMRFR